MEVSLLTFLFDVWESKERKQGVSHYSCKPYKTRWGQEEKEESCEYGRSNVPDTMNLGRFIKRLDVEINVLWGF